MSTDSVEGIRTKYDSPVFGLIASCWGEHLHMGLFESDDEALGIATERAKNDGNLGSVGSFPTRGSPPRMPNDMTPPCGEKSCGTDV